MRLTQQQIDAIKQTAADVMGGPVQVLLFGSRTDESRRGGDIDLYIAQPALPQALQPEVKLRLLVKLKQKIGDQRIDVVFAPAQGQTACPIQTIAQQTGIPL